jgi:hypothetical protein
MFGISVFSTYNVKIECEGSQYLYTDYENDDYFEKYSFTKEHTMQGGELLEKIGDELKSEDVIAFGFKDDKLCFHFYQMNGSFCDKKYIIKEQTDV